MYFSIFFRLLVLLAKITLFFDLPSVRYAFFVAGLAQDEALLQIDDKEYTIDGRKVVKVGINFSSKERTIKEWKVLRCQ